MKDYSPQSAALSGRGGVWGGGGGEFLYVYKGFQLAQLQWVVLVPRHANTSTIFVVVVVAANGRCARWFHRLASMGDNPEKAETIAALQYITRHSIFGSIYN